MKIYVMVKADPFGHEIYLGAASTKKKAEKELRKKYPHMRSMGSPDFNAYTADSTNRLLLFIHEDEVI